MFVIPFQVSAAEYSVFIVIEDKNIERMRLYDPAEVNIDKLSAQFSSLQLKDILVGYGTREDFEAITKMVGSGTSVQDVLKLLTRGWAYRPNQGDHDGPGLSLFTDITETKH